MESLKCVPIDNCHMRNVLLDEEINVHENEMVASRLKSPISTKTMDFMRGFAAVYVVLNHVRGAFFIGGTALIAEAATRPLSLFDYAAIAVLQFTSLGTEFVIMFFCVSGMAMAHAVANSTRLLEFYHRRFIRIWPTYFLAVLVAAIAAAFMVSINPDNPVSGAASSLLDWSKITNMLLYLDVSSNLTPQFWSLPYEVIFYILAPILLASRVSTLVGLLFGLVLSFYAAAVFGLQINPARAVIYNFFLNALFWFMAGAAAYHYFDHIPRPRPVCFWIIVACLLIAVLAIKMAFGGSNAISNTVMIVVTLLCARNLPAKLVEFRPTNWGRFSYSIYVYHYALIGLISFSLIELFAIQPMEIRSYFAWMAFVPPILLACYALFFLAEKPSNDLLRKGREMQLDTRINPADRAATSSASTPGRMRP